MKHPLPAPILRATGLGLGFLLSVALPGCTPDEGATTDESETASESEGESEGETGEPAYALGERSSEACIAVENNWIPILTSKGKDPTAATAAYEGAIQEYIRASDAITGRDDDATITAALADGDFLTLRQRIEVALSFRLRTEVSAPEKLVEDPYAAWDEAYCLWKGVLRGLALEANTPETAAYDADLLATIDNAFLRGHEGIHGELPTASIDDWAIPPAKQEIEKNLFRVLHRKLVTDATAAAGGDDDDAAARALIYLDGLRDRLDGRNTPGIAAIENMLGEPDAIEVDAIVRELNIAFVKRTRKYCDEAILVDALGIPSGYKGAVEGAVYQALIAPDMAARLASSHPDYDPAAYQGVWDTYVEAIRTGDDPEGAAALSVTLVEWNCAYQDVLGIAECTASADEPGA